MTRTVFCLLLALSALAAWAAAPSGHASGTVEIVGYELGWISEGRGPDVLVLGSSVYYQRMFSAGLRQRVRLHFVDGRQFARRRPSSQDATAMDLDTIVAEIEALRAALGLERVIVLGHSNHGPMGAAYAARHPARVSHLVIVGAVPRRTSTAVDPARTSTPPPRPSGRRRHARASRNSAPSWPATCPRKKNS
jgi:pimeloyl-ACP methyl ester carboxylesterase